MEHPDEFLVLYSRFPLAVYFTHGSVYMSILISQFIPPPLPSLCPRICSIHLPLYSCPASRFICTINYQTFLSALFITVVLVLCMLPGSLQVVSTYMLDVQMREDIRKGSELYPVM